MKTPLIIGLLSTCLLCNSCSDCQFHGFATGSSLGGMLGSSIGAIASGPRGYHLGTITGMVAGGAIGMAATAKRTESPKVQSRSYEEDDYERSSYAQDPEYDIEDDIYYLGKEQSRNKDVPRYKYDNRDSDDYCYHNEYDEVEYSQYKPNYRKASNVNLAQALKIEQIRFTDSNGDRSLNSEEHAYLAMVIYNRSDHTLYNVAPQIECNNSKIMISPAAYISELAPNQGFRYRAEVIARKMKDGETLFRISFGNGKQKQTIKSFKIHTRR